MRTRTSLARGGSSVTSAMRTGASFSKQTAALMLMPTLRGRQLLQIVQDAGGGDVGARARSGDHERLVR